MKPKVLMISGNGLGNGGMQTVIMSIIRILGEKYQFDVLTFSDDDNYYKKEVEQQGKVFCISYDFHATGIRSYIEMLKQSWNCYFGVKKILKDNGPYVAVHNHSIVGACLYAAKNGGVQNRIAHSHLTANPTSRENWVRTLYRKLCIYMLNKYATKRIGCSEAACNWLFGNNEAEVVFNAIDLDRFAYKVDERHNPLNGSGTINYVSIGRFSYQKNQDFVIDIFYELHKVRPHDRLYFVGYGDDENKLRTKVIDLELDDSISFYRHDIDIPDLLTRMDILLFPSNYEGLGIVMIEAQAMGLYCFASTAVPREADLGRCEFLNLSEGADMWANRIIDYVENNFVPKTEVNMSSYDIHNVGKRYDEIYQENG